jgi:methionyl-tRNA formyltransferase
VAEGEAVTGVTTMRIDAGLDTGDMLLAQIVPIALKATAADLFESLAAVGAKLMVKTLRRLTEGDVSLDPQNHALATHAPILKREDGLIDFTRTARRVYDRWRGFQPWPGAYTTLRGKKLIVPRMRLTDEHSTAAPGTLLTRADQFLVVCGENTVLALDEVQLEGKRRMTAAEFLHGFKPTPGEQLGQ